MFHFCVTAEALPLLLQKKHRCYNMVCDSTIWSYIQYSQRNVYILRVHVQTKKGLSSLQNPRKTHAKSSQNPRYFHATSTLIPRSGSVSCVRFHARSTFSKKNHAQEKKSRSRKKNSRSCENLEAHGQYM